MINNPDHITAPTMKAASAVLVAGGVISLPTLTELNLWVQVVAGVLAACYSATLLGEWLWKRCIKPRGRARGWLKGRDLDGNR
jgi:4-hydroxybenzoate polyprenyltransferase